MGPNGFNMHWRGWWASKRNIFLLCPGAPFYVLFSPFWSLFYGVVHFRIDLLFVRRTVTEDQAF